MTRHPIAVLGAATVLLLGSACTGADPDPETPTQGSDTSLVTYWTEHPDLAPEEVTSGMVLLDEQHTGSHIFNLPSTTGLADLTVGVSCGDDVEGRPWTAAFGDDRFVGHGQVASGCGGSGANLGSYPNDPDDPYTRVYVLVDDDITYSVGVWGSTTPTTPQSSPATDPETPAPSGGLP